MNKEQYLPEDQDLLDELNSIGPLSTGVVLEEQKRKIQVVQIKSLLRSRKAARDTEESETNYSNALLIFATVQFIVGIFQLIQSSLNSNNNSALYFGLIAVIVIGLTAFYFLNLIKK